MNTPLNIDLAAYMEQVKFLAPEMILVIGGLLLLVAEAFLKSKNIGKNLFLVSLTGAFAYALVQQFPFNKFEPVLIWNVILLDKASLIFFFIFTLAGIFFLFSYWRKVRAVELFFALIMVMAAFIIVKAVNLLVLLLAIEILSIGAYSLSAMQHTAAAKEAAIKYIIFGGVSTAIFLFGLSLLFGLTGTLNIHEEVFAQSLINQQGPVLMIIFILIFVGLFFKITAFPFHLWAPDIYEAVPAPIAAFFSVLPKLAVLGFIIKYVLAINLFNIIEVPWEIFLAVIAILTMTVGNLAALSQKNAKRMMAYSSVAHTGFFLMAIVAFQVFAFQALLFYGAVYLLMNFGAFLLIHLYEEKMGLTEVKQYSGLAKRYPYHAVGIVIVMISLTGLPPTAGFTAKLFVFSAVYDAYQASSLEILWWLLIAGIINTVVSLFYYLKIPYFMIFKPEIKPVGPSVSFIYSVNFFLAILVLPLIIIFIRPDLLMDWINMINFAL
ncbi:MAG: NADH-quinone oxidoreductase subunit N [Candidatus Cyclobacteriaceae bacterium M2_1C_046]